MTLRAPAYSDATAVPVRTKAPIAAVILVDELRRHCRVDPNSTEHDVDLMALEKSAVSLLDGYRGRLGRCILEQEWTVSYGMAGLYRLPLPDVVEVTATNALGAEVAASLSQDALGSLIYLSAPAEVVMKIKLPDDALDAIKVAVKMLVGHWFRNPEAVVTGTIATNLPLTVDSIVNQIRWSRI